MNLGTVYLLQGDPARQQRYRYVLTQDPHHTVPSAAFNWSTPSKTLTAQIIGQRPQFIAGLQRPRIQLVSPLRDHQVRHRLTQIHIRPFR